VDRDTPDVSKSRARAGLTLGIAGLVVLSGCGGTAGPDPQVTVEPASEQAAAVEQDLRVVCDAEHVDHEDGVDLMYLVAPGAPLECTVTGLATNQLHTERRGLVNHRGDPPAP
jgi:hypothetical protein